MEELLKLFISVGILLLGIPIGNLLRKHTTDELKLGERWFKYLIIASLFGGFIGLIFQKDWIMFSCFFIAIVTSRSLILNK